MSKTETPDIVEMLAETSEACAEDCNTGIAAVMKMAAAEIERLRSELARTERNRDMWKGQCERQTELMAATRRATPTLAAGRE